MFAAKQELERLGLLLGGYGKKNYSKQGEYEDSGESDEFSQLEERCFYAGDATLLKKRFVKNSTLFLVFSIIAGFLTSFFLTPIIFSLAVYFELKKLDWAANKRSRLFERDYSAFLLSFAASVRTGLDPLVAFSNCAKLFQADSLVKKEIEAFKDSLDRGRREEKALAEFAASIRHPDIKLLRAAIILARKQGSSLAECLQRLARITRQRQSFRRKIKAALAMQRMSAIGISSCAFIIAIIQGIANPEGIKIALSTPMGQKMIGLGVGLMLLGLFWMLRMAREKI